MRTLITGGARSGKSRHAERQALATALPVTVIATALAQDEEMRHRIAMHRATRPVGWTVVEEPLHLVAALQAVDSPGRVVLVDCLTLWVTQLLCSDDPALMTAETDALLDLVPRLAAETWFISNETGLGITPLGELTRRFVDTMGRLHQELAARCDRVLFMVAGIPLTIKGTP